MDKSPNPPTRATGDSKKTRPLSEAELQSTGTTNGYNIIETPQVTNPNGVPIKSDSSSTGYRTTEKPIITDQFGRPIESITKPLETTPQPETTPQNINRPGYVSPYETPEERNTRIKRTQDEISGINTLNPDNLADFNYAAFAYRDPNATKQSQNPEPTTPTPPEPTPPIPQPEPTPQEVTVSREDGNKVKQTVLPGFDLTSFPEEPISGGPAVEVNPRMEPIGRDNQGNIIEQGNMFSLGKQKETEQPNTEPVKEPEQPEGPLVLDTLIQQGTQSELYSSRIETIRRKGDEVEAAFMGATAKSNGMWDQIKAGIKNIIPRFKNSLTRARAEIQASREISDKEPMEVIFGNRSIAEARMIQDQIAQEGASLLANDLLSSAASQSKFEKVYASLDGKPEFEVAKEELVKLIKKYSVRDSRTGVFLDRKDFETEKNSIVEVIVGLAPESADKEALENTIDGFWNNVEMLRAKNFSAEKIAQMEIILNIKMARGSFLRQTEIQKNLSNNLAEALRNTKVLRSLPVRWRDAIAIGVPTAFTIASRTASHPLVAWATFGIAPAASFATSAIIEKKRKHDETDTTRRILARSIAAGGDPREVLTRYNPEHISNTVNQVDITKLTNDIDFALQSLKAPADNVTENNLRTQQVLYLLARYMSLTEQATKDKFDYFTASSEQELIGSKNRAAQLAQEVRNQIYELKNTGRINLDINSEFKTTYQAVTQDIEKSKKINSDLFKALQSRTSRKSALIKGSIAGAFSIVGGTIAGIAEHGLGPFFEKIADEFGMTLNQLKDLLYIESLQGSETPEFVTTPEICDPNEFTTAVERSLTPSEILSGGMEKYPNQYLDIIQNGAYHYQDGFWDQTQLNGGETWNNFLNQSDILDRSEIYSIADPALQVEAMGTETHSFWGDSDQSILNITGRDFIKGPNGEFIDHTHKILEDGTKEYFRKITPFNDFLTSKVESGDFDISVYLKDGNVVRVPSEYISVTENGVSVDFKNVPGIIGEIWKSGNTGLADAVRYGYTDEAGLHAMVSTIDINGPAEDLSSVINTWNPGDVVQTNYSTTDLITKDCLPPTPIPPPELLKGIPVLAFGPGSSGVERRYEYKDDVNPSTGEIRNQRNIETPNLPEITLNSSELLNYSNTQEFKYDLNINGKLGVIETLSRASVQAALILELLNQNDEKYNDAIMDAKRMLLTNLDVLSSKIKKLIDSDKKYEYLKEDLENLKKLTKFLKQSKVNSQYNRDLFQNSLQKYLIKYLGKFYTNPTTQVPKVNYEEKNQESAQNKVKPEPVATIAPTQENSLESGRKNVDIEASNTEDVESAEWESSMQTYSELDSMVKLINSGESIDLILKNYQEQSPKILNYFINKYKGNDSFVKTFTKSYKKHFKEIENILIKAKAGSLNKFTLDDGSEIPGSTDSEKTVFLLKNIMSRIWDKKGVTIIESKKN